MSDNIRITLNSLTVILLATSVLITNTSINQLKDRTEALEANQVTVQEEVSEVRNND